MVQIESAFLNGAKYIHALAYAHKPNCFAFSGNAKIHEKIVDLMHINCPKGIGCPHYIPLNVDIPSLSELKGAVYHLESQLTYRDKKVRVFLDKDHDAYQHAYYNIVNFAISLNIEQLSIGFELLEKFPINEQPSPSLVLHSLNMKIWSIKCGESR
ncbi:MAG: hypothetical protein EZS28_023801, partial [Streblomastix strix]